MEVKESEAEVETLVVRKTTMVLRPFSVRRQLFLLAVFYTFALCSFCAVKLRVSLLVRFGSETESQDSQQIRCRGPRYNPSPGDGRRSRSVPMKSFSMT